MPLDACGARHAPIVYIERARITGSLIVITRAKLRRPVGALLVIVGAILMWLAPGPMFTSLSGAGLTLLLAGIVLELVGIALERRAEDRKIRRSPHS
jgi:drug/metabolite transporter (DMT)-like permease